MHPSNTHLSHKVSSKHREIVAPGNKAFEESTTVIETRIGTLQEDLEAVTAAGRWHGRPREDLQGALGRPAGCQRTTYNSRTASTPASPSSRQPRTRDVLAKSCMPTPLTSPAGLTGSPSTGPSSTPARTLSTGLNSRGTRFTSVRFPSRSLILCCVLTLYITGGKINEQAYCDLMYPNVAHQASYAYPRVKSVSPRSATPAATPRCP